jgi:hypothetical protein
MTDETLPALPPAPGPVRRFFNDLVLLLTEPVRFYSDRFQEISIQHALVFGLVVNWIAAFFDWLTRLVKNESLLDGVLRVKRQLESLPFWNQLPETLWDQRANPEAIPAWLAELTGIALSPFQSLLRFAVSGAALYVCALVLIRRSEKGTDRVEIPVFIRLQALASTPNLIASLLGFLPVGLGGFIGWVYGVALLFLGLKVRFRISSLRAIVLMILPGILGFFIAACVLGGIVALAIALLAALFGAH